MSESEKEKEHPWVTLYDKYGDDGALSGNAEGLELLKAKIDEAIENGEVQIRPELDGDFIEIRREEKRPNLEEEKSSTSEDFMQYGCAAAGLLLLIVVGFGIKGIYDLLFAN